MVESLLIKKNKHYDIYFYENTSLSLYSPFLLDLNEHLPKSFINLYDPKVVRELCTYDDRLIGIVCK